MAKKREDPPEIIKAYIPKVVVRKAPETETTMFFKGFDDIQARYKDVDPEAEVEARRGDLDKAWTDLTTPKSPLTPYEAGLAAETFAIQANLAALGMTVGLIAAEAASLGQLDVNLAKLLDLPIVKATFSAAERVRMARLDTAFIKAANHLWLWQYRPTLVPEGVAIDMYAKGLIGQESYRWYMAHYGYTDERSDIIGYSAYRFPGTGEILDLLRRGVLSEDGAVAWLKLNRIPEATARALLTLKDQIPGPGDLVNIYAKRLMTDKEYKASMAWHGIPSGLADRLRWAADVRPAPRDLTEMLWRGLIDPKVFTDIMQRLKYHDDDIKRYISLAEQIPPAADLVTMVVREAFVPEMVTPAPDVFAKYMSMKGFSKEWSDRYWTMHWTPIELRQAYENLWRGFWTKDQFMMALHIADVHPMWREDIYNVAFRPPGMREMGYGYDVGVYTEEDIAMYRRWDGLSPEDAAKAAKSMVAYRTEAEREAVRREHMHLFALGKETLTQFEAHLKRLGTAPAAVPLWLERAALEKDRRIKEPAMPEQRTVSSSEALYAYQAGLRPEAWTRERLADLGWTPERIDLALERVEVLDTGVDEANRIRTLLLEKTREGFVKSSELEDWLTRLGFSANVIDLSLAYAYLSQDWDDVKEQAAEWWRLAKAGKITPEAYGQEARKLGMTETRITSKMDLLRKLAEIRAAEEAAKAKPAK